MSAIDFARSLMATRAVDDGFEHIMWIDDDIVFDPNDVIRLRESGAPLVAGVYAKKGTRALAIHVEPGTKSLTFGKGGGQVAVRYAATGFLYTHRSVYERLRTHLPTCNSGFEETVVPYFLPMVIEDPRRGHWYLAEDFAFCERARQAGIPILVDTRMRLLHIGAYTYGWEDAGRDVARFDSFEYTFT